jgi:hypothetical protein
LCGGAALVLKLTLLAEERDGTPDRSRHARRATESILLQNLKLRRYRDSE